MKSSLSMEDKEDVPILFEEQLQNNMEEISNNITTTLFITRQFQL